MMGVFAEFERAMIEERIQAGLARARAKGTRSGRAIGRPTVGSIVEELIKRLRAEGLGMLKIAKKLDVASLSYNECWRRAEQAMLGRWRLGRRCGMSLEQFGTPVMLNESLMASPNTASRCDQQLVSRGRQSVKPRCERFLEFAANPGRATPRHQLVFQPPWR
jgi:hypothetical protein